MSVAGGYSPWEPLHLEHGRGWQRGLKRPRFDYNTLWRLKCAAYPFQGKYAVGISTPSGYFPYPFPAYHTAAMCRLLALVFCFVTSTAAAPGPLDQVFATIAAASGPLHAEAVTSVLSAVAGKAPALTVTVSPIQPDPGNSCPAPGPVESYLTDMFLSFGVSCKRGCGPVGWSRGQVSIVPSRLQLEPPPAQGGASKLKQHTHNLPLEHGSLSRC
jgi:hypothetical protein